jgi:hypothetical protein
MSCENKEYEKSKTNVDEIPTIDFIILIPFSITKGGGVEEP